MSCDFCLDFLLVGAEEDDIDMPAILGRIDLIEDGIVSGWACEKGDPSKPHQVHFNTSL